MCATHPGADRHIGAELTASKARHDADGRPAPDTTARHCGYAVVAFFPADPGAEDGNAGLEMLIICISVS